MSKHTTGQFKESENGLRDVSFDEGEAPGSWKHRLHYVPLTILIAASVGAAGVGYWYQVTHPTATPAAPVPAQESNAFNAATAQTMPETCAPTPRRDVGPWTPGVAGSGGYASTQDAEAAFLAGMEGAGYYVEGRDGYLFLSDVFNQNFSQALGRTRPSAEQISAWDAYMTRIENAANAQGATALFVPAPATWDIYADQLPQWSDPLGGTTSFDLMRLALPQHAWVDVRPALMQARQSDPSTPLYSRVNPHWSPQGALIASHQVLDCLSALDSSWEGAPRLTPSGVTVQDAPNEYEALGWNGHTPADWAAPTYDTNPGNVHMLRLDGMDDLTDAANVLESVRNAPEVSLSTPTDFENRPALTYNPSGRGRALLIRDSQGNNFAPGIEAAFEYTIQAGHGLDTDNPTDIASLIEAYQPDVVIVEFTQRYFALTPASVQ